MKKIFLLSLFTIGFIAKSAAALSYAKELTTSSNTYRNYYHYQRNFYSTYCRNYLAYSITDSPPQVVRIASDYP